MLCLRVPWMNKMVNWELGMDSMHAHEHQHDVDVDQRRAAMFILKAKEVRMITQDSLDGLLEDITGYLLTLCTCLSTKEAPCRACPRPVGHKRVITIIRVIAT